VIGLVLVTHGRLATEFLAALEHVVGAQSQCAAISIEPDDDMERRRRDILDAVARVDDGAGVIVATDMFGGTPSNLAISIIDALPGAGDGRRGRVEVIAGVNLPLLIKIASLRANSGLAETVEAAQIAGRKYITVASSLLAGER
jgi:PTS system mannose-specific IIA component